MTTIETYALAIPFVLGAAFCAWHCLWDAIGRSPPDDGPVSRERGARER